MKKTRPEPTAEELENARKLGARNFSKGYRREPKRAKGAWREAYIEGWDKAAADYDPAGAAIQDAHDQAMDAWAAANL